ncbi:Uma2 family endonuclease [Clostridium sp. WILCCON 0269]|uniref:Uma2 family endonuclease n=1 Tax=Candidatus Clostridium eludens TaxID=3381663 RepID=A0ABW8SH48_9CLOT
MDNTAKNKTYTYADYINYPENERIELVEGKIYSMAPAPSRIHQKIIMELSTIINSYIKSNNGLCEVYAAPFDVFLANDESLDNCKNIVQPDISVICDRDKLNDKGCIGAPDMIIEVVSPYNPNNDYIRKLNLYDQYKVREYWIVNPMEESILVYKLDKNDQYAAPKVYTFKDIIKVSIYDTLEIDFSKLNLL